MSEKDTILVNGQRYNALTGLPVNASDAAAPTRPTATHHQTPATRVHTATQKSHTLHRGATKKPVPATRSTAPKSPATRRSAQTMDIAKHPSVTKFGHTQAVATNGEKTSSPEPAPKPHPAAQKAHVRSVARHVPAASAKPTPAKEQKEAEIAKALAKPIKKHPKKAFYTRHPRLFSVVTASVLLLVVAASLLYFNLPNLSVKVAAMRAGIAASYPEYKPDGYRIKTPVQSSDGEVRVEFASNTSDTSFTITQTKSSWDSSAVRDKVATETQNQFITTQDRGLTIYTYSGNAAWVNRGILYTITGDAPLSSEQILRIAASL